MKRIIVTFFAFSSALLCLKGQSYIITTVAGNGNRPRSPWVYSGDGGLATSAELYFPSGVSVDASGNIYISDEDNNRIRKVNTSGSISTVAGNGKFGHAGDGGLATSAELTSPKGVAVDAFGNIYIADAANERIREVNTNGVISTIAGNGTMDESGRGGYNGDNIAAIDAELYYPAGVCVDASGNIYIADTGNNRIRKVDKGGIISTIAGVGFGGYCGDGDVASSAELDGPVGVSVDTQGNIYIADQYNSRIRMVNTNGAISTVAGNGTSGYFGDGRLAITAELGSPTAVSVDALGNIYIVDAYYSLVRKVNTRGVIYTIAGNGTAGYDGDNIAATSAELNNPTGLVVDGSGNIYIADIGNQRIRKLTVVVDANK